MGWPKKNKEKEEVTPPDNPPVAPPTRHQQLVHVMDKIWKPYKDEAEEFKVDVHYFKKFMDLVYSVYIKRGSRHQRRLLEDFFDEETAPSKDTQKADWVRTVGSMIIREPLLRDGLELSVRGQVLRERSVLRAAKPPWLTCTTAIIDLILQARLAHGTGAKGRKRQLEHSVGNSATRVSLLQEPPPSSPRRQGHVVHERKHHWSRYVGADTRP